MFDLNFNKDDSFFTEKKLGRRLYFLKEVKIFFEWLRLFQRSINVWGGRLKFLSDG